MGLFYKSPLKVPELFDMNSEKCAIFFGGNSEYLLFEVSSEKSIIF